MSILLDSVKKYFFNSHLKINSSVALIAFMPLFAIAFSSSVPSEGSVLNGIKTSVRVSCDSQIHKTDTYASTVSQALTDTPCGLKENDIVNPPANTRLDGSSLDIVVIKATPVTIFDGDKVIMTKSAYRNGREILEQLNIEVHPEDEVKTELIMSNFNEDGLGQKITINRAPAITLEADGNIFEIRTLKKTVGAFLEEKGIVLGPKDELSPSTETNITSGMKVTVVRISEKDITEDVTIPYTTINKRDNSLYQGQSRVETEGVNGQKKVTSKVVYRNGVEVSKTVLSEEVMIAPQSRVVVKGIKSYPDQYLWDWIISREGGPTSVNPSSLACGIAQSNPCSKVLIFAGVDLSKYNLNTYSGVRAAISTVPIETQRAWMRKYILGRYGSFSSAKIFWEIHGWY